MERRFSSVKHVFVSVFLLGMGRVMVMPAMTDVTILALCPPSQHHCSLPIYLSGIQQAMVGVGSMVMTPLLANLSDSYGRKSLLTLCITLSIIPSVILAYRRTTPFFYAYYALKTLTDMIGEATISCLTLAHLADNTPDVKRGSAFGILAGVGSAAFLSGTIASRFLSMDFTFKVSAVLSMVSTVYVRIFLEESIACDDDLIRHPILKETYCCDNTHTRITTEGFKKMPSAGNIINLLKTSRTFCQAASTSFFHGLSDGGLQASLLYFLKARFHFNKDRFADLMLINSLAATVSQLLVMPLLAPKVREEKLLSMGLLLSSISSFVYSISWSEWVPYAIAVFPVITALARPALSSIASKQVGPHEQGMLQGCLSGISSLANIIAPLIFSPLTAWFLSDEAPFFFPGFSIMCFGIASMISFIQSLLIEAVPPTMNCKTCNDTDPEV